MVLIRVGIYADCRSTEIGKDYNDYQAGPGQTCIDGVCDDNSTTTTAPNTNSTTTTATDNSTTTTAPDTNSSKYYFRYFFRYYFLIFGQST